MKNLSRRSFLGGLSLGAAALASPVSLTGCAPASDSQEDDDVLRGSLNANSPNVLIIHTDQQDRWTLGCYGDSPVDTPHIDALARGGVVLDDFFTNGATCTPSRGCLVSGLYPHQNGAYRNSEPIKSSVVTFAQSLKDAGYQTGYVGKWHLAGAAEPGWRPSPSMGFTDERWMYNSGHYKTFIDQGAQPPRTNHHIGDEDTYSTDWMARKTIELLQGRKKGVPFCFMVAIPDPHDPYVVRAPYSGMFKPADMPVPKTFKPSRAMSTGELQGIKAQYCGMVKCIDDRVGEILAELEAQGLAHNTIVVFMTDHGDYLGEHSRMGKDFYYEGALRIPCIVRFPGRIPGNRHLARMISMVDMAPTLLGLTGVTSGVAFSGRDASTLLQGQDDGTWEDEVHVHRYRQLFKDESKGPDTLNPFACTFTPDHELVVQKDHAPLLFRRSDYPDKLVNLYKDLPSVSSDLAARMMANARAVQSPQLPWLEKWLPGV